MGSLLLELIPSAFGLALAPTAVVVCVMFLGSRWPIANGLAFAAPFVLIYGSLSVIVLALGEERSEPLISADTKHLILLVTGSVLLASGLRMLLRRAMLPSMQPAWMRTVETASPPKAFGFGVVLAIVNPSVPILIGGLAIVAAAEVETLGRVTAVVVLILAAEAGIAGPIGWYWVNSTHAADSLQRLKAWIMERQRVLNGSVLLIFGTIFAAHGLAGFW